MNNQLNSMMGLGQVHWNMNMAFLMQLDRRREEKAQASINGDLSTWWACTWEIYEGISGLLTDKENLALKKQLKDIYGDLSENLLKTYTTSQEERQTNQLNRFSATADKLREIGLNLMELMFRYEVVYISPKKRTTQEKLREDSRNN